MCRIAGIVSENIAATDFKNDVRAMCNAMRHGGPDDEGFFVSPDGAICFGHRRLSLLDLSQAGHQPMSANEEKAWICFNGEVYNFLEIRKELEALGHVFKSGTDTEVILKSYLQWGTSCFARFNGMFAFALADLSKQKVFLVRDAAGIKPLYYSINENSLFFASEVKAFKQVTNGFGENPDWKMLLLAFGHIPEPYTTLKNVFSLAKGHYLEYNLSSKNAAIHQFRSLGFQNTSIKNKDEALKIIREKLEAAVSRHLISDAPIGLFLSGGIDSSLLTLLAAKSIKEQLHTLSVTFNEEKYSEKIYQQAIIDKVKCKHQFYNVSAKELDTNFAKLLAAYDQPSNDAINSWFISKCAHDNGLKAVLSGLGSDEVFGGYPSFKRAPSLLGFQKLPGFLLETAKLSPDNRLQRLQWLKIKNSTGMYLAIRGFFSPLEISRILGMDSDEVIKKIAGLQFQPQQKDIEKDEYACWLEFNRYMQNQLLKDSDYMSMQHGLELRVPFLDQDFLDAVFSIDRQLLYKHGGIPKQLLVDAFKSTLPEIIWNRNKMGFSFPFQEWLGKIGIVRDSLNQTVAGKNLLHQFDQGKLHWSKLWTYYLSQNFEA